MKTTINSSLILLIILFSCTNPRQQVKETSPKLNRLRHIIHETEILSLPCIFDANKMHFTTGYQVNPSTQDSLLFHESPLTLFNYLPDTSTYFAFLYGEAGDIIYPGIMTFDKSGILISKKVIATCNCLTNPILDVESCFDSVIIGKDLSILSFSKLKATVQPYDTSNATFDASSDDKLIGRIKPNGFIEIETGKKK
jgi:hypothetical protein